MASFSFNQKQFADKVQISKILGIEPDADSKTEGKQTIVVLNGEIYKVTADMQGEQCLELIKLKTLARKRNLSGEKEEVEIEKPLYGKKEVVCVNRQEGDSLQKLALTFNCTIAEIKLANKIYNEQEFHALRTVKIPVIKDGSLYDHYTRLNKETVSETKKENTKETIGFVPGLSESNCKLSVQKLHEIDPNLNYVNGDDDLVSCDFEDGDDYESGNPSLHKNSQLIRCQNAVYPVNICESTLPEFMNKMDETIKKNIKDVDYSKENFGADPSIDDQMGFQFYVKEISDEYGSVFSLTWKHFIFIICMIAIIIPLIYIICYVYK